MGYTTVYQQQEDGHWVHQNYSTVGIDSLLWGKLSGDWPLPFNVIWHRGYGTNIAVLILPFWGIMACSTLNLTFCQREYLDTVCCNISCRVPLCW